MKEVQTSLEPFPYASFSYLNDESFVKGTVKVELVTPTDSFVVLHNYINNLYIIDFQ
jgi:hypothetical protein